LDGVVLSDNNKQVEEMMHKAFVLNNVKRQRDVAARANVEYLRTFYCPRLDYAIVPFNIDKDAGTNGPKKRWCASKIYWFDKKVEGRVRLS